MADPDNWTVVASVWRSKSVSTAEILRMVADGWHLTPGTAAYQTCVDQLRARADEEDAKTVQPDPSAPVPIPLPPEPPHDRVVEAVDQDGTVVEQWRPDPTYEHGWWDRREFPRVWSDIVSIALVRKLPLWHVAAESGEQS